MSLSPKIAAKPFTEQVTTLIYTLKRNHEVL